MATEKERIRSTLYEWQDERDWVKKVINNPKASEKDKENAKQRLKVAETWIAKILKDFPEFA